MLNQLKRVWIFGRGPIGIPGMASPPSVLYLLQDLFRLNVCMKVHNPISMVHINNIGQAKYARDKKNL